jgi:hypothetical protein
MHLLWSLLFLLAIMVLALAYVTAAYFLVQIILQVVRPFIGKIKKEPGPHGVRKTARPQKSLNKLVIFLGQKKTGMDLCLSQDAERLGPRSRGEPFNFMYFLQLVGCSCSRRQMNFGSP